MEGVIAGTMKGLFRGSEWLLYQRIVHTERRSIVMIRRCRNCNLLHLGELRIVFDHLYQLPLCKDTFRRNVAMTTTLMAYKVLEWKALLSNLTLS